jgi:hypothetical protein
LSRIRRKLKPPNNDGDELSLEDVLVFLHNAQIVTTPESATSKRIDALAEYGKIMLDGLKQDVMDGALTKEELVFVLTSAAYELMRS